MILLVLAILAMLAEIACSLRPPSAVELGDMQQGAEPADQRPLAGGIHRHGQGDRPPGRRTPRPACGLFDAARPQPDLHARRAGGARTRGQMTILRQALANHATVDQSREADERQAGWPAIGPYGARSGSVRA